MSRRVSFVGCLPLPKGPILHVISGLGARNSGGVSYTRWGSSTCPDVPGTNLVYAGITGSSHHRDSNGGAANHLCMPPNPDYTLTLESGLRAVGAFLYGVQYQSPLVAREVGDVPCAVCFTATRGAALMVPAKTTCPTGWTTEYIGYLMTERTHDVHLRSIYECVDSGQEYMISAVPAAGGLLTHVEARCGTLKCPPYVAENELTCAVCTI